MYIRVLKSYSKFQGNSSEKTWLFSIARNVAIDWFRKQKNWKQRLIDKFDWTEQQIKDDQPSRGNYPSKRGSSTYYE